MSRGNGGQPIITKDDDWDKFREVIATVKRSSDFHLYAYCLMSNHFHFLIQAGAVSLSRIMQRIQTTWSKRFNIERRRMGHVFQGRFKSLACDEDPYFLWLLRYIHLNPVRAGLVKRPEDWAWSSYREYLEPRESGLADTGWPLSLFASERGSAVESFRKFVHLALDEEAEPIALSDSRARFVPVERPSPAFEARPALESLAAKAALDARVDPATVLGPCRIREVCAARRLFSARAVAAGYGCAELARALGISTSAVSRMLRRPC